MINHILGIASILLFACLVIYLLVLADKYHERNCNRARNNQIPPKRNPTSLGPWHGRRTFDSGYMICGCFPMCRVDCPERALCIIESGPLHYARLPPQRASLMPLFNAAKEKRLGLKRYGDDWMVKL